MTKKTNHLGRQTGGSSDRFMSPQRPYTGDGRVTRSMFDKVQVIFQSGESGKK